LTRAVAAHDRQYRHGDYALLERALVGNDDRGTRNESQNKNGGKSAHGLHSLQETAEILSIWLGIFANRDDGVPKAGTSPVGA